MAEILTSTGRIGVDRFRSENRLYITGTRPGVDASDVRNKWEQATRIGNQYEQFSRTVYRGVVGQNVAESIVTDPTLRGDLEVAVAVEDGVLIYLARNAVDRAPLDAQYILPRNTELSQLIKPSNEQRVKELRGNGFSFVSDFVTGQKLGEEKKVSDVPRILELWGPTFGWDEQQILGLRQRLLNQQELGVEPQVWFNGIRDASGSLVSLVTAERLDIPGMNGTISLVESTEWVTDRERCNVPGLITANIILLNAQVIRDMRNAGIENPLIYAETNRSSPSPFAGEGAGLEIPDVNIAGYKVPQIIRQNVGVRDGRTDIPAREKRDFNFMILPQRAIARDYSPRQIDTLMREAEMAGIAA